MTKTALLKLFVAIVIMFILILPEYFKTPKGRMLELSCLEVCLQPNFTYSLSSLNYSFVTFLQPVRETQTIMGIFLNHFNFQNVTKICRDITCEFKMCSLCLVCESKGNVSFISQEQTSKGLIMNGSTEVEENDFYSPCQHFNFTVTTVVDHLEEFNTTCDLKTHTKISTMVEEDSTKEKSLNQTCRIMEYLNNCSHISLHLEMDVNNVTCSTKITWYVLVLLIFIFSIILMIHKILGDHRRVQKWQSDQYEPTSVLLRGSDSEKPRALNVRVISGNFCGSPTEHSSGNSKAAPFLYRTKYRLTLLSLNSRIHARATLSPGQGSASPNSRTRSHACSASARSMRMTVPGQFGLNPLEEHL